MRARPSCAPWPTTTKRSRSWPSPKALLWTRTSSRSSCSEAADLRLDRPRRCIARSHLSWHPYLPAMKSNGEIRVVVVEDRQEERERFVRLLNSTPGFRCVTACATGEEAGETVQAPKPDIILLDIQ